MKLLALIVLVAIVAFAAYRILLPKAFVAAGRRGLTADRITVERVIVERSVTGYEGQRVDADPARKFVTFDLRLAAGEGGFDVYDFQLVKAQTAELGKEENIGDNTDDNYFFWSPLDSESSDSANTRVRISFQVPEDATTGYLFYWGTYVGPLELAGDSERVEKTNTLRGAIEWGGNWKAVPENSGLQQELDRELDDRHPLAITKPVVFGRCFACDDVVVRLKHPADGPELAVIHLTWSGRAEKVRADGGASPYFERLALDDFVARYVRGGEHA